jgi:hypothetical protein
MGYRGVGEQPLDVLLKEGEEVAPTMDATAMTANTRRDQAGGPGRHR